MKQELMLDYDITCKNLVDIDQQINGFEEEVGEFYDFDSGDTIEVKILKDNNGRAIMKSKDDGRYVLEVEDFMEGTVEYFYSFNINDLV